MLVLNKTDRVTPDALTVLEAMLRKLQPRARIIRSSYGAIDPRQILGTALFDFEEASNSPGWLAELAKPEHTPETEEYGISSFVFRSRRPFHPARLNAFLDAWPESIVRAKGYLWVATGNDAVILLQHAGRSLNLAPVVKVRLALEAALLTEAELNQDWSTLTDPLPAFSAEVCELPAA